MQTQAIKTDNELQQIGGFLCREFKDDKTQADAILDILAELKAMMQEDIVHFIFNKTDGTIRHAYGTRAIDVIRRYDTGSVTQQSKPHRAFSGTFPYFDIEKKEWRCFRVDRIVEIDNNYTI